MSLRSPFPAWRSMIEALPRRAIPKPPPSPPSDPTTRWMEIAVICLMSLLSHALLGFILVMFYFEAPCEPDPVYSVTVWRDARGKDVLKIGAPDEGPPTKGVDAAPEPAKKEEPPKVESPKAPAPVPDPAPRPAPVLEPIVKAPEPVAPPPKVEPDGGVKDPLPPAVALGAGASAGAPRSETPGAAKASAGPEPDVTDAEIDKDPTA